MADTKKQFTHYLQPGDSIITKKERDLINDRDKRLTAELEAAKKKLAEQEEILERLNRLGRR